MTGLSAFKLLLAVLMLAMCLFQSLVPVTFAETSGAEANSTLGSAELTVLSAYRSVLKAEQAGANVSSLLICLNDAGDLLAKAREEYNLSEFDKSVNSSNLAAKIGESVNNDANELWTEASGSKVISDWVTIIGSSVALLIVGFGSFLSWRFFKKRYLRRVLKMRPEVGSYEP